jgi:catechol 2,3-dioxygenase-like lactoylglutathione lyase family enzyme
VDGADVEIAFLKAPGHTLELIEYRKPAAKGRVNAQPSDTGFAHVAFNVDHVPAAVAAARVHGVEPIAAPVAIDQGPNKGRRVVYLRDWNGITIELIEVK